MLGMLVQGQKFKLEYPNTSEKWADLFVGSHLGKPSEKKQD